MNRLFETHGRQIGLGLVCTLLASLGTFLVVAVLQAQEDLPAGSDDCMMCHEVGRPGPRVAGEAPRFSARDLLASPHAPLECTDCHQDLADGDYPHAAKLERVQCGGCHGDVQEEYDESLHGRALTRGDRLAPTCQHCHGNHTIRFHSAEDARTSIMNIPTLCGRCHREGSEVSLTHAIPQDSILTNYSQSIHGEGLFKKGLVVTAVCTSCHTAHHVLPHTDPRSSISKGKIADTCTQCHARIEEVHRKVIRGELWEEKPHAIPACVDCHSPHKIRKVFYTQGMADRDCMRCHSKHDLVSETGIPSDSLFVDMPLLEKSRHSEVSCVQCHTGAEPAHERPCSTVDDRVDCTNCHVEIGDEYATSTHGKLAAEKSPDAPRCNDCHGTHGILGKKDSSSPTFARRVPALCGECHRTGHQAAVRYTGKQVEVVESYRESIHGKGLLESGLVVTATCANCHSAHGELPASDPNSTVHADNVASTCAQCHTGIYELFQESVHSPTVTKTDLKLPVCSDCHSAHTIKRVDVSDFQLHIMDQCGGCHDHIAETYFETYHGKVSKLGYVETAKCYDCHGAHEIYPVWDSRSWLHRDNIVETCGQCHPGANRRFAGYLTHATHHDPEKYPWLFYTFWGMTILLLGTLIFFGVHTLAWIPRSIQFRKKLREAHAADSTQYVRRFKPFYRRLHLMVIMSFFALALTGMSLKFSYAGWARFLARLFGGFESAGAIHRAAAVVTFAYFFLHVWDLIRNKRKEAGGLKNLILGPNSMLPNKTDLKEFVGSLKWFVGLGERPQYGRWTYWEKFDYFAVFWGVSMIGMTGLLLWFPEFFTRFIPGKVLNVATIIHSDEALLAVGFIFTIHFFNTHFRPEKFPMDPVIFTGRIPLEEFKVDRPREYAELVASGRLEEHLVDAPSADSIKFWRVFGLTMLTIGLTLIALIVYAVLFAYR